MNNSENIINCPICGRKIVFNKINQHLDICTTTQKRPSDQPTFQGFLKKRQHEVIELKDGVSTDKGNEAKHISCASKRGFGDESENEKHNISQVEKQSATIPLRNDQTELKHLQKIQRLPLSEKLRPKSLNEFIGQQGILNKQSGTLYQFIEKGSIPSMILWGPPGVGKTSLARLLTNSVNSDPNSSLKYILVEVSATKANSNDLRSIFEKGRKEYQLTRRMTVLFVDEIHRFNKTQQDLLLPHVEGGDVILIGATTENPSFQLNNALLSRCQLFVLTSLSEKELKIVLVRAIAMLNKFRTILWKCPNPFKLDEESFSYIYGLAMGDTRRAINLLELIEVSSRFRIEEALTMKKIKDLISANGELRTYYDTHGDNHYDSISAFHKSVRGGDENASLYYLARMLQGGEDPLYIARRMIRIASEDIGLADHSLLPLSVAAYEAVMKVGLPEAELALAQCAVALTRAPKSVELYRGWGKLNSMLRQNQFGAASAAIPLHIRNAPTKMMEELGYKKGYKYNPDYKNGEVAQEYFPESLLEKVAKEDLVFLDGRPLGDKIDPDLRKVD